MGAEESFSGWPGAAAFFMGFEHISAMRLPVSFVSTTGLPILDVAISTSLLPRHPNALIIAQESTDWFCVPLLPRVPRQRLGYGGSEPTSLNLAILDIASSTEAPLRPTS